MAYFAHPCTYQQNSALSQHLLWPIPGHSCIHMFHLEDCLSPAYVVNHFPSAKHDPLSCMNMQVVWTLFYWAVKYYFIASVWLTYPELQWWQNFNQQQTQLQQYLLVTRTFVTFDVVTKWFGNLPCNAECLGLSLPRGGRDTEQVHSSWDGGGA